MALYQRLSPAQGRQSDSNGDGDGDGSNSAEDSLLKKQPETETKAKYRLLRANELPSWYAHNTYLLTGYGSVNGSVRSCIASLRSVHNETVNVYSHLIPAAMAFASNCFLHLYFQSHCPGSPPADRLAVHVYLTTSVLCFAVSSVYHALLCHSEALSDFWCRWDYAGITLQTTGSFVSGIYVSFYCDPGLQKLYWAMTGAFGLASTVIIANPRFQSYQWRTLRISTFVAMGLSAIMPMIHAASIYPFAQLHERTGISYYLLEGLALIVGTVFYATHFPESWAPKTFDIWGPSHQLFHICVVLSAAIHIRGILTVYDWVYNNPQCLS